MKRLGFVPLLVLLLTASIALAQQWKTGKLIDTEQQKVKEGTTTTYHSDSGSKNATATKSDNIDTYQVFTIQDATKTYVVRQKLNFPWSKPANISLGEEVKFTIQGNRMTILDDDQKQQKATIVKASLNPAQ